MIEVDDDFASLEVVKWGIRQNSDFPDFCGFLTGTKHDIKSIGYFIEPECGQ